MPNETTPTARAVAAIVRNAYAADAPPSLARVMDALRAINGRRLTKREHAGLNAAAGVALFIGYETTAAGFVIETADRHKRADGWRLRLSWEKGCPTVDADAIERDNPAYFIGAADRNAIRAGYLADPSRIQAIADAVDAYRAAVAAMDAALAYPFPDRYEIRRELAECDRHQFAETIKTLTA